MYKICIWTPTATHHQSAFHDALVKSGKFDLEVRYFNKISQERLALGWEDKKCTKSFEQRVETLDDALLSLSDVNEYTHMISGNGYAFTRELIAYCISNNLKWINWTERSGGGLFRLLGENSILFKLFFPIYQRVYNRKFAQQIERYALGTLVSGIKAEEDYLARGVSKAKIKHLYYALEPLEQSPNIPGELKNNQHKYNFIYVGSLSHRKGIDVLLKSFAQLDQDVWGLILVGKDTTDGRYLQQAKDLSIDRLVTFTGAIDFDKINEYMSFGDIFILPTRFDGWGAVLNEAASLGLPLISTDECGAAHHLIKNQVNGFVVKSGDVSSLSHAMQYFINNPKKLKEFGSKSLEISNDFLPERNVLRLLSALDEWIVA